MFMKSTLIVMLLGLAVPASTKAIEQCTPETFQQRQEPVASLKDLALAIDQRMANRLKLLRVNVISGPCASMTKRAVMGQIEISDGRIFQVGAQEKNVAIDQDRSIYSIVEEAPSPPRYMGLPAKQTQKIDGYGAQDIKVYLGLWSSSRKSAVGIFVEQHGSSRSPVLLLSSKLDITGIGYFPSPHKNGQLFLVQRSSKGTREIVFDLDTDDWLTAFQ